VTQGPKTRGDGPTGPAATGRIEAAHHGAKRVIGRIVALVVTGVALYVVLPSLTAVFGAWPRLAKLSGVWLVAALLAEAASFVCTFACRDISCTVFGTNFSLLRAARLFEGKAPLRVKGKIPVDTVPGRFIIILIR